MENKDVKNKASKLVREYSLQAEKNLEGNELAVAIGQKERAAIDLERRKARENLEWRQWLRFADLNVYAFDDGRHCSRSFADSDVLIVMMVI